MSHSVGVKDTPSRATSDANVVTKIREAGGIPILVSNTPELCMWWHTFNKVTGATKNPYDNRKTAGGSSGGEVLFSFLKEHIHTIPLQKISIKVHNYLFK